MRNLLLLFILALLGVNAKIQAQTYPLLVRGSTDFDVLKLSYADADLIIVFIPSGRSANAGLAPGQGSWLDRGIGKNEPVTIRQKMPLSQAQSIIHDLRNPSSYWTFYCANTNRGYFNASNSQKRIQIQMMQPQVLIDRDHQRRAAALTPATLAGTPADSVYDLQPFLQTKASCDFQKSRDEDGCIIIKYSDGFIKKECRGAVTEVTTPDGKRHVNKRPIMSLKMLVMKFPPPNPLSSANDYEWLNNYNSDLLLTINSILENNQTLIKKYLSSEKMTCGTSIYNQIVYRSMTINDFLKAK